MCKVLNSRMEGLGWVIASTGGGCMAFTCYITPTKYLMVTDEGGLSLPQNLSDRVMVGYYDKDTLVFYINTKFEEVISGNIITCI